MTLDLGPKRAYVVKGILRRAATTLNGPTKFEQGKGLPSWPQITALLQDLAAGKITVSKLLKS